MRFVFKNESGQVMVLFAMLMVVLVGATALCVDYGLTAREARILQNAADSAALAAAPFIPDCTEDEVKAKALEYAEKNGVDKTQTEVEVFDSTSYSLPETGQDSNVEVRRQMFVTVTTTSTVKFYFSRIFGINEKNISRKATASLSAVIGLKGCVPFSIDINEFESAVANNDYYMTLKFGGGSGTQGAYGALALAGPGASVYKDCIINGYNGLVSVGDVVDTSNGNMSGPTEEGVQKRYNACTHYSSSGGCTPEHYDKNCPRIMMIPVVDYIEKHTVQIMGFAPFLLDSYHGSGNECFVYGTYLPSFITEGETDPSIPSSSYGPYTVKLTG